MKTGSAAVDLAVDWLRDCKFLFVLTGAGVSKESGIPTFRDALEGFWSNYNPEELATPQGFKNNPSLVWQWYDSRRQKVKDVEPNPGHFAIAELQKLVPNFFLCTQNVDGLHIRAGSTDVVEIHGSLSRFKCFDREHEALDVPFDLKEPPQCECGSLIRPAVVWFNEAMPEKLLKASFVAAGKADVALVVGTSGLVHPAASLPYIAKQAGARIIEVNPNRTELTESADLFLAGPSGVVLPQLVEKLKSAE
jgi:NAD-dependent deacetylase